MARMAQSSAARPRFLLSSAKPAVAVALGLCLLAACKSVPAIDPGKPPAMDPASANTQPPASAFHSIAAVVAARLARMRSPRVGTCGFW